VEFLRGIISRSMAYATPRIIPPNNKNARLTEEYIAAQAARGAFSIPIPKPPGTYKVKVTPNYRKIRNNYEAGLIRRGMSPENAKIQANQLYGNLSNINSSNGSPPYPYYSGSKPRRKTRKQRKKTNN
jgi:hypothetical protein